MGKGGIPLEVSGSHQNFKLDHLETAELRKWAKKYGEDDSSDRKVLLQKLVRGLRSHGCSEIGMMHIDATNSFPITPLIFHR